MLYHYPSHCHLLSPGFVQSVICIMYSRVSDQCCLTIVYSPCHWMPPFVEGSLLRYPMKSPSAECSLLRYAWMPPSAECSLLRYAWMPPSTECSLLRHAWMLPPTIHLNAPSAECSLLRYAWMPPSAKCSLQRYTWMLPPTIHLKSTSAQWSLERYTWMLSPTIHLKSPSAKCSLQRYTWMLSPTIHLKSPSAECSLEQYTLNAAVRWMPPPTILSECRRPLNAIAVFTDKNKLYIIVSPREKRTVMRLSKQVPVWLSWQTAHINRFLPCSCIYLMFISKKLSFSLGITVSRPVF